jgi:hypothetical protein
VTCIVTRKGLNNERATRQCVCVRLCLCEGDDARHNDDDHMKQCTQRALNVIMQREVRLGRWGVNAATHMPPPLPLQALTWLRVKERMW